MGGGAPPLGRSTAGRSWRARTEATTLALVTGASGFIGGHLVEHLRARGDSVRAFVRPTSQAQVAERAGAELALGDITEPASLLAALRGVDICYHTAAIVNDWAGPGEFEAVNQGGTRNVAEACLEAGARLLHVSSTDVYGFPDQGGLDESQPLRKRGWGYVDNKIEGELAVSAAVARGLSAVIVRPASVYGPRCPYFVVYCAELMKKGELPLIGEGRATGGFIYVEDLCRLIIAAGDLAEVGEAFNGTGGDETWKEFYDRLATATGVPPIRDNIGKQEAYDEAAVLERASRADPAWPRPALTHHAWAMYATDQHFSHAKATRILGWEPKVDLAEGMRRTGEWWHAEYGA